MSLREDHVSLHRDDDVVLVGLLPLEGALRGEVRGRCGAVGAVDALHVELVPVVRGGPHHAVARTVPAPPTPHSPLRCRSITEHSSTAITVVIYLQHLTIWPNCYYKS